MKSLDNPRARNGMSARLTAASALGVAAVMMAPLAVAQDSATVTQSTMKVADTPVLLGDPYAAYGQSFTPSDVVDYDDVGRIAILPIGGDRVTVRGEPYDGTAMAASHPTLPLPTYVEVTELEGGRTVLVRVADRGPGRSGALLGVTPAVARALGIGEGAPVRVRRVNPPEAERALLRDGQAAHERLATPDSLLVVLRKKAATLGAPVVVAAPVTPVDIAASEPAARPAVKPPAKTAVKPPVRPARAAPNVTRHVGTPPPGTTYDASPSPAAEAAATADAAARAATRASAKPAPVAAKPAPARASASTPAATGYVIQLGAFANRASADALARRAGASVSARGNLWRVRVGPYPTEAAARSACEGLAKKGVTVARVMRADS